MDAFDTLAALIVALTYNKNNISEFQDGLQTVLLNVLTYLISSGFLSGGQFTSFCKIRRLSQQNKTKYRRIIKHKNLKNTTYFFEIYQYFSIFESHFWPLFLSSPVHVLKTGLHKDLENVTLCQQFS